jgi:hypothetical protein
MPLRILVLTSILAAPNFPLPVAAGLACGLSTSDWCPAPMGDPCGNHKDAASCHADPRCYGMPYRGESVVACIFDGRGFAKNCPTVGCTSTPPRNR